MINDEPTTPTPSNSSHDDTATHIDNLPSMADARAAWPSSDDPAQAHDSVETIAPDAISNWLTRPLLPAEHGSPPIDASAGDPFRTHAELSTLTGPLPESDAAQYRVPSRTGGLRFSIVRKHARGGLGEVFLALDQELQREVALKEIQDQHADHPGHRVRFRFEAEVTGGLEHPGIVPVYGLGQYADGRPYYAMRFIQGQSLQQAIHRVHKIEDAQERRSELRKLIGRFIAVCQTIAYAHSRSILHRDLKPDNVMLGPYGETLVVDWGLAKAIKPQDGAAAEAPSALTPVRCDDLAIDPAKELRPPSNSEMELTMAGAVVGTPQYMSPEQANGVVDGLGPASDVYSLGATLYAILAGRAPFRGTKCDTVLKQVLAGEFPPPSRERGDVPAPLEAICLKAMRLRPEERYPSARALADDVQRWLSDEPVSAYREGVSHRLARWMRHHRAATQATAAALVAVALVACAAALMIHRSRAETDANYRQARKTVDDYLSLVSDSVELRRDLPGMQKFRKELLGKALDYYKGFLAKHDGEASLRRDVAATYFRLGRVTEQVGSKVEALDTYRTAWSMLTALRAESPNDVQVRLQLGETDLRMGVLQYHGGRLDRADSQLRQAVGILEGVVGSEPRDPESNRLLADAYTALGVLQKLTGRFEDAEESYRRACGILSRVVEQRPDDAAFLADLAETYNRLGELLGTTSHRDASVESHAKALAILTKLLARNPNDAAYELDLAVTYNNLATQLRVIGRLDEARESNNRAFKTLDKLLASTPDDPRTRAQKALAYNNRGMLRRGDGLIPLAVDDFESTLAIQAGLVARDPAEPEYRRDWATTYNNLGALQRDVGRYDAAAERFARARDIQMRLIADNPTVPLYRGDLARTYDNLGDIQCDANRFGEAERNYLLARDLLSELVAANPRVTFFSGFLARTYNNLGDLKRRTGHDDAARRSYEQADELFQKLVVENPSIVAFKRSLATTYVGLGILRREAGDLKGAEPWFDKARQVGRKMAETKAGSNDPVARALMGENLAEYAKTLVLLGRDDEALVAYREAAQQQRVGVSKSPFVVRFRHQLGETYKGLARLERSMKRPNAAAATTSLRRRLCAGDPNELYEVAREFALCIPLMPGEAIERAHYADLAMSALREAVASGFRDFSLMSRDAELSPLASREDFRRLATEVMDRAVPEDPFRN